MDTRLNRQKHQDCYEGVIMNVTVDYIYRTMLAKYVYSNHVDSCEFWLEQLMKCEKEKHEE